MEEYSLRKTDPLVCSQIMGTHAAEDYSKIATADTVLTYSQTAQEKRLGLARVFVDKARTEEDKIEIVVSDGRVLYMDRDALAALPNGIEDVSTRVPGRSGSAADVLLGV